VLTLKEGKIVDEWSQLLPGCEGLSEGLLRAVERNLDAAKPPGVTWKRESVAPGWLKGLFGKRRDFLLVSNERFDEYLVCVNARDYGTYLDVAWYFTVAPKLLSKIAAIAPGGGWLQRELDIFDSQDLGSYRAVTRVAVIEAVEALTEERKIDLARVERRSGRRSVG